jgi:hypothetical protein
MRAHKLTGERGAGSPESWDEETNSVPEYHNQGQNAMAGILTWRKKSFTCLVTPFYFWQK